MAGEAHAAFFHLSASEFVEAIVGVGASRVRDLFKQAKEAAPSIVFIDELDAIGRSRSGNYGGISGGNDEREQTLNQILTEMDGFEPGTNVIVLGATNRPEILDPALLRPGRFDRRIAVSPPDQPGRVAILKIHTRSVPLADDVDLERIASSIPGSTGADIALLVNESALAAARHNHAKVEQSDITESIEKILLGAERQIVMTDDDRKRTAYHESGHALVGMLTPGADPVRKISIIPRGQALGVTLSTPETDRYNLRLEEVLAQIKVALGGRAAEKVIFDDLSTGAESDIQNLTQVARGMVGRWGMSDAIGPIAVTDGRQDGALLPGTVPGLGADPGAGRSGGPPDRRRGRARCGRAARARARPARVSRQRAAGARDARPAGGLRGRPRPVARRRRGGTGEGDGGGFLALGHAGAPIASSTSEQACSQRLHSSPQSRQCSW